MILSPTNKNEIDKLDLVELLRIWRFAPPGDPRMQGETGKYIAERMQDLRAAAGGAQAWVSASKEVGW